MEIVPLLSGVDAARWVADRRYALIDERAREAVRPILAAVRERGDAALRELTERYEGARISAFRVSEHDRAKALADLGSDERRALEAARDNIERFHRAQIRSEAPVEVRPGLTVWREFRAIERIGIYVPGGRASYPSSVLMCGIPANLAGCSQIALCTPPNSEGRVPQPVLAAAELLGIDEIFAVGGAQAIAALAYGTESITRVDKIFGPGNRYVTAAKELVYGIVNIDMPAGPSEIVVLADGRANPAWVAADLLSQAEHAPDSLAVCIVVGRGLAEAIAAQIANQLQDLCDPEAARASLASSAICVADHREQAIAWTNVLAPEHLSIVTDDDDGVLERISHAGSIFIGSHSPVAAGDYTAGSNHVLPTARRARAWSALSLDDFGRWIQAQRISPVGLAEIGPATSTLARWEGFEAHARAVEIRLRESE